MPEPIVLQKLLNSNTATAIVENGHDQVGGYVTMASEVAGLRTPADLLGAYGVTGAPEFVDVVRFSQPRLATFSAPSGGERPWHTFANGFLAGDSLAQVWIMGRTRYPYGAEYWRIRSDGEQKRLSRYEGAARGWHRARQWRPPSTVVGTMARWRGGEFLADVMTDGVLLTLLAAEAPPGFEQIRPGAWSATVPLTECAVFERVYTAELDGIPIRLLRTTQGRAEVLLLSDDPADAERVGAHFAEPGVFELAVEAKRLANVRGVENQLTPASQ
ncbi:hypothetical protein [Mycobacterium sp. GA-2829]|uniref:hypothetical protein n=1 Tax=Mycobacterium sp. GA-2829 TaxID=1772283 RepID=UPI00073FCA02|nr:hypothetical protein [Mycobacterium sp. GA-2829]KUI39785.1 hypothetical protein AU194_24155 [Mycobacterium sp. GA-2829]